MRGWRLSWYKWHGKLAKWVLPAAVLAALVGLWQVPPRPGRSPTCSGLEPFLVPSPAEIASALWDNRSLLAENAWVTLRGDLLRLPRSASPSGLAFGFLLRPFETLRLSFYPLIVGSQAIPIIVFAPILVVWFGYGIGPKLAVVALVCFFPIAVATADGLRAVDPEATKMMRIARRLPRSAALATGSAHRPSVHLQRRQDRRHLRPDRRGLRRVGRRGLRARSPDPPGQRATRDRAGLRGGLPAVRHRARSLRPDRPRGAPRRHLAIELRG